MRESQFLRMITSTSNARVKQARKLLQKRQRHAAGRLLLEGVRLVADAWRAQTTPETVFYTAALIDADNAAASLVAQMAQAGVECLPCSPEVFATLAETLTPQGIAAVVPMPALPAPSNPTLLLILDGVRDPGNAGALLRSAAGVGVDMVLFGPETVDPFNDKVLRAGMGAHFRIPLRVYRSWAEIQAQLPAICDLYMAAAGGEILYDQVDWRHPSALVVGGEAVGASSPARQAAQPVAIPMQRDVESLNAAVAGAVILFEAARQRRIAASVSPACPSDENDCARL